MVLKGGDGSVDIPQVCEAFKQCMLAVHWSNMEREKKSLQAVLVQGQLILNQKRVNNGRRDNSGKLV